MRPQPGIARLVVYALFCLAIAYFTTVGLEMVARGQGEIPRLLRMTPARFPAGVAIGLDALAGYAIDIWSRRSIFVNVAAAAICIGAPFALAYWGNGVSCLRWWECLR